MPQRHQRARPQRPARQSGTGASQCGVSTQCAGNTYSLRRNNTADARAGGAEAAARGVRDGAHEQLAAAASVSSGADADDTTDGAYVDVSAEAVSLLFDEWTLAGVRGDPLGAVADAPPPHPPVLPPIAADIVFASRPTPATGVVTAGDAAWRVPAVRHCFDSPLGAEYAATIRTPGGVRPRRFRRLERWRPPQLFMLSEDDAGRQAGAALGEWWSAQGRADLAHRRRVGDVHRDRARDLALVASGGEFSEVLDLRGPVPVPVAQLPPPTNGLCADAIAASLAGYAGKDELLRVVTHGARFGAVVRKVTILSTNNRSAMGGAAAAELDRITQAELAAGWLTWHATPPFMPMRVHPRGFVWKAALPGPEGAPAALEGRPLADYSTPAPAAANCGGDPTSLKPVNFGTFDACVEGALALRGRHPTATLFISKIDIRKAYRQVSNASDELWLHCSSWGGGFIVDHRVGFGGFSSPANFTLFEKAFQWAWRRRLRDLPAAALDDVGDLGSEAEQLAAVRATDDELLTLRSQAAVTIAVQMRAEAATHTIGDVASTTGLLDDNICVVAGRLNCLIAVREGVKILRAWGLPHNEKKLALEGVPRRERVVFGVGLSLATWQRSVPAARRRQVANELARVVDGDMLPFELVHSMTMRLLFFSRAAPRGRAHLNGLLFVVRGKGPGDRVKITAAARRGARWWHQFVVGIDPWDGVSLLVDDRPEMRAAGSDASDWGLGIWCAGRYTAEPWLPDEKLLPIAQREALALLCLVVMHRDVLARRRVRLDQDNENVFYTYTNQRSQWPELYDIIDMVDAACAKFEIDMSLRLVKSADNPLPDALSRGGIGAFLAAASTEPFPLTQVRLPSSLRTLWRRKLGL